MNKKLIITYFEEFKHWLNGGKLQVKFVNGPWEEAPKDIFSYSTVNFVLVIDDSYSDYRKALAEGKSIEFYELVDEDEFDSTKDVYKWLEWRSATPSSAFTKTLNYRIKPEELKFKVGDWVRDKKRKHKPFMVTSSDLEADSPNYVKIDCELWQPQPGEWCWYSKWDKIVCVESYLCKYALDMNEVEPEYKHKYEPFIGQLPSYLKESK